MQMIPYRQVEVYRFFYFFLCYARFLCIDTSHWQSILSNINLSTSSKLDDHRIAGLENNSTTCFSNSLSPYHIPTAVLVVQLPEVAPIFSQVTVLAGVRVWFICLRE